MSHRILRILYLLVPLGLIAAFALRPTPIVGVDGESLAASTGAPVNEINAVPCDDQGDDVWLCTYPGSAEPASGDPRPTTYEVTIDGWGCWSIGGIRGSVEPPAMTGCVTLMDHIESID